MVKAKLAPDEEFNSCCNAACATPKVNKDLCAPCYPGAVERLQETSASSGTEDEFGPAVVADRQIGQLDEIEIPAISEIGPADPPSADELTAIWAAYPTPSSLPSTSLSPSPRVFMPTGRLLLVFQQPAKPHCARTK